MYMILAEGIAYKTKPRPVLELYNTSKTLKKRLTPWQQFPLAQKQQLKIKNIFHQGNIQG